jgi:thiamine kinase-like enzyme
VVVVVVIVDVGTTIVWLLLLVGVNSSLRQENNATLKLRIKIIFFMMIVLIINKNLYTKISKINLESLYHNPVYSLFHGDLQFDNIVYNEELDKYTYIDWRESFGGSTKGGDVYYDLAKLYGGCIIPYNLMKEESWVKLYEGSSVINYSYSVPVNLTKFKNEYEKWIVENGFDLNRVKLITGLIFLNMSPLHDEKFAKMLWFKSIEILSAFNK